MLSLLSPIYGKIAEIRNARYESGRTPTFDLGARTISVGNVTAGGTGKTPLVIMIAQRLAGRGKRVCILTRGYGRANPGKRVIVTDGKTLLADARTGGDEPMEMARSLRGRAIIIADRDRVAAAKWAAEEYGVTHFILDDGFQHRRARRDLDIVCIDATDPFGGGKMLPAGRLREPLENLRRADVIVITRANLAKDLEEVRSQIAGYNTHCHLFTASTKMGEMTLLKKFLSFDKDVEVRMPAIDLARLANSSAYAFCGIGNPGSFFGQLKMDNFDIAGQQAFADHHVYTAKDIAGIAKKAREAGAGYLLTTSKDAMKLGGINFDIPVFVLEARMVIDDVEKFGSLL